MENINATPAQYYSYIKGLAQKHKLLKHTDSEKHYFRGELEEFYMSFRNDINFPCLIAENFTLEFVTEDGVCKKIRETPFIVAESYKEENDYNDIDIKQNNCEIIGDEILRRLKYDQREMCGYEFEYGEGIPVMNEANKYVGIRYTVSVKSVFDDDYNPENWDE